MSEHRRIEITGSAITPDIDFVATHTRWTAGSDLAAGEIRELTPRESKIGYWFEVFDGMGDGDVTVAAGSATIDIEFVARDVDDFGNDIFRDRVGEAGVVAQRDKIETEIFRTGLTIIRVTAAANLPATGSIRIYVDQGVKS